MLSRVRELPQRICNINLSLIFWGQTWPCPLFFRNFNTFPYKGVPYKKLSVVNLCVVYRCIGVAPSTQRESAPPLCRAFHIALFLSSFSPFFSHQRTNERTNARQNFISPPIRRRPAAPRATAAESPPFCRRARPFPGSAGKKPTEGEGQRRAASCFR